MMECAPSPVGCERACQNHDETRNAYDTAARREKYSATPLPPEKNACRAGNRDCDPQPPAYRLTPPSAKDATAGKANEVPDATKCYDRHGLMQANLSLSMSYRRNTCYVRFAARGGIRLFAALKAQQCRGEIARLAIFGSRAAKHYPKPSPPRLHSRPGCLRAASSVLQIRSPGLADHRRAWPGA